MICSDILYNFFKPAAEKSRFFLVVPLFDYVNIR